MTIARQFTCFNPMAKPDLDTAANIDFSELDLNFEGFRALARNPNLDVHGRIGFPTSYREGFEANILADVVSKLPALVDSEGCTILDIGPGCANLPKMIIELCNQRRHKIILADSEEMLAQLPDVHEVTYKCGGAFPKNVEMIRDIAKDGVDVILCYSVLQYMFVDVNPFEAVDAAMGLLSSGGRALFGDIPNASKRRRFFASDTGLRFHQAFTGKSDAPKVAFNELSPGRIDDAVISGLMQRAQLAGYDAYLLPQRPDLPMANRRDDLLIARP